MERIDVYYDTGYDGVCQDHDEEEPSSLLDIVSGISEKTSTDKNLEYINKCYAIRQKLAGWMTMYADFCEDDPDSGLDVDLLRSKISALKACGTQYMTMGCYDCGRDDVKNVPYRCKLRVCPECSTIRKNEWLDRYKSYLESVPSFRIRHMTLTLANADDLPATLTKIQKGFKALRTHWFKDRIEGGLVGYEFHLGKSGGRWNVHCHVLYVGSFIPHSELSATWEKITGDSKVVDIRSIGRGFYCKRRNRKVSAQEKALDYVLKYISKGVGIDGVPDSELAFPGGWGAEEWKKNTKIEPRQKEHRLSGEAVANWDIPALVDLLMQGHKRRLVFAFGSLYGESEKVEHEMECPLCGGGNVYLFDVNALVMVWDSHEEANKVMADYVRRKHQADEQAEVLQVVSYG